MKITLSSPIFVSGVETDTLEMREPEVEDMLAMKKSKKTPGEAEVDLFANLCMVEPAAIRKMKYRDYGKLQKAFGDFVKSEDDAKEDETPLE